MKSAFKSIILVLLLGIAPLTQADQNQDVLDWSQQTLLNTLGVSYNQKLHRMTEIKKNYSFNAWDGIVGFLGSSMETIKKKKLILHPTVVTAPTIIKSGTASGIQFWRVQLSLAVPELNVTLEFTLLILASAAESGYPYIIQNLNIKVTPL